MNSQENILILKQISKKISNKLHCDRHGSCVHFAEIFVEEVNDKYPELLNDFDVIEGYVNAKFGNGIPQEHTWIRLNNGEIIDPTFSQFDKYDSNANYSKKRTKVYSAQKYYDEGKEGSWFSERRKKLPSTVFKEGKRETIKRILREENFIPSPIKRRISPEDIEEAFEFALEQNADSMNNPRSIIFKEKEHTTLWLFAKFVIDDMVTHIEQESFNDDNRVYFSDNEEDDEYYHEKIRKPLLRHYGKRIKEKYNEVKLGDINESRFIQETIRKFYNKEDKPRGKYSDRLEKMTTDFIGKDKICDIFALYSNKTYLVMVLYNGSSNNYLDEELQNFLKTIVPVNLFTLITDTNCKED
jgi:hypothetical protein